MNAVRKFILMIFSDIFWPEDRNAPIVFLLISQTNVHSFTREPVKVAKSNTFSCKIRAHKLFLNPTY